MSVGTPFAEAQPGVVGVTTRGALAFLRAIVNVIPSNASLKYGVGKSIDEISEYLKIREEIGLEYLFARAVFEGCLAPAVGEHATYEVLRRKFEQFDRRHQELVVTAHEVPLLIREQNAQRLMAIVSGRKAELMRAFHIAEAHDADGPWVRSVEKLEIFALLVKTLTGHLLESRDTAARTLNDTHP